MRRREEAEGPVDAEVVVVDRLGEVDDAQRAADPGIELLHPVEVVGRLERVVAADGDERVDLDCLEGREDGPQLARSSRRRPGPRPTRSALPGFARDVRKMMSLRLRMPETSSRSQAHEVRALLERRRPAEYRSRFS